MDEKQTNEKQDGASVEKWGQAYKDLKAEMSKVIVGQDEVIEHMIVAILARGHALLEGVPGVAKTLMVNALAEAMDLSFHRIQFTPDLMPSDITGTNVLREDTITHQHSYSFLKGPIFANIVLADEINRTPPKTQAAMLQGMEERMVSAGGQDYDMPDPFFVLATQNPLEQEGTYPLPQVQLDRFVLYVKVNYPSVAEEWEIVRNVTSGLIGQRALSDIKAVLHAEQILEAQELVMRMEASDQVIGYSWALARGSRPRTGGAGVGSGAPDEIGKWINWGAGPRGVLALINCAKAHALIHGRQNATVEDVNWGVRGCLRHRISPNYAAISAGITSENVIDMLLKAIPSDKAYTRPTE